MMVLRRVGGVGAKELAGLDLSAGLGLKVINFNLGAGVMIYRTTVECSDALSLMT